MKVPVEIFSQHQAIRAQSGQILSIRGEFKIYVKSECDDKYCIYLNTAVFNPKIIFSGTKEETEQVMKKLSRQLVQRPLDLTN